jgi:hypothetical protein
VRNSYSDYNDVAILSLLTERDYKLKCLHRVIDPDSLDSFGSNQLADAARYLSDIVMLNYRLKVAVNRAEKGRTAAPSRPAPEPITEAPAPAPVQAPAPPPAPHTPARRKIGKPPGWEVGGR